MQQGGVRVRVVPEQGRVQARRARARQDAAASRRQGLGSYSLLALIEALGV